MAPANREFSPIIDALQRTLRARRAVTVSNQNLPLYVLTVTQYRDQLRNLKMLLDQTLPHVEASLRFLAAHRCQIVHERQR